MVSVTLLPLTEGRTSIADGTNRTVCFRDRLAGSVPVIGVIVLFLGSIGVDVVAGAVVADVEANAIAEVVVLAFEDAAVKLLFVAPCCEVLRGALI